MGRKPKKRQPKPRGVIGAQIRVVDKYQASANGELPPRVRVDIDVPGDGEVSYEWLREAGLVMYASSTDRPSIADLAKHPLFKDRVPLGTLEKWAAKDHWTEERKRTAEQWRQALILETGKELVESRRVLLHRLRYLSGKILDKLMPGEDGEFALPVNSYEALVNAFVRLVSMQDSMTTEVLSTTLPEIEAQQSKSPSEGVERKVGRELSIEEARIGAKAILAARREEMRKRLGTSEDD